VQGRAGASSSERNNAAPLSEYFNSNDGMKPNKKLSWGI
jgi:hypothetical protein